MIDAHINQSILRIDRLITTMDAHNPSIEPEERIFHIEVYTRLRYTYIHLREAWLRMRIASICCERPVTEDPIGSVKVLLTCNFIHIRTYVRMTRTLSIVSQGPTVTEGSGGLLSLLLGYILFLGKPFEPVYKDMNSH